MKKKYLFGLASLLLLAGCAATSSQNQGQNTSAPSEKSLVVGDTQFVATLDPAHDYDGWFTVRFGIGETLFKMSDQLTLEPWLATGYEKIDDSTWKIQLRDKVSFSNGKKMDAQAVIDSLKRFGENNVTGTVFKEASYQVEDAQTLTIKTANPQPLFINDLTDPKTAIVDASASDVVATGPYAIKTFKANDSVVLTPNAHYWQDKGKLDQVTFQYIPDPKTLALSLVSGQLDAGVDLSDDIMDTFQGKANISSQNVASSRVYHLEFNQNRLTNKGVRLALIHAINKSQITDQLLKGQVTPTDSAFPSQSLYSPKPFANQHYDLEAAQKLLASAGYTQKNADGILVDGSGSPLMVKLRTYKRLNNEKIATALQAQFKALGVQLDLEVAEKVDALYQGDYDIALASAVTMPTPSPYYFLNSTLGEKGGLNYVNNGDAKLQAQLEDLAQAETDEQRQAQVSAIQAYAYEEGLVDYIGFVNLHEAMSSQVKNFQISPTDYYQINHQTEKVK